MNIYLLRHGVAEQGSAWKQDSLRPLTSQGREEMQQIAQAFKTLGLSFDTLFSSPYRRAKETMEIVVQTFGLRPEEVHTTENLTPNASFVLLIKELSLVAWDARSILLTGHEPQLSSFASFLLNDEENRIQLEKGGIIHLSTERLTSSGHRVVLEGLWTPSLLLKIPTPDGSVLERH